MKILRGDQRPVLLVLPAIGFLAVLVAALFGLSERPVRSAQVFAGPSGGGPISGRILVVEEAGGLTRPVAGEEVSVALFAGSLAHEAMVRTGEDGVADFSVSAFERSGELRLVVRQASGGVLVEGPFAPSPDSYLRAPRRGGKVSLRSREGDRLDVAVERGVLAVPFEGKLELRPVAPWALSEARFRASLRGASLREPREFSLAPESPRELELVAEAHVIELTLEAALPGGVTRTFSGYLPVVPGAFGIRFDDDRVTVVAPVPRAEAFYTLVTERRRIASGRVPLFGRPDGTSAGSLEVPLARGVSPEARFLVLATDADGRSPSTVGYGLAPYRATLDALDERLLDGSSVARALERRRSGRVRLALLGHVAFVFAMTLFLFVRYLRGETRKMRASLGRSGVDPAAVSPGGFVFGAALLLVVGMSAALVWAALVRSF